jgi:cell division protein FtsB
MTIQEIPLAPRPGTAPSGHAPKARRPWPWVAVGIFVAVIVGLAGVIVWLMATTVSTGDYDDAVADFEAAQTEVAALEEANSDLTADLASLSDERDQLVASIAATAIAAKARAYVDLNFDEMYVDEMAQAGTDFAPFDDLLATLGEDMTFEQWAASGRAFGAAERYVYDTNDAQLIDAWNEWLNTEIGSAEDLAAYDKIVLRLDQLINEQPTPANSDAG